MQWVLAYDGACGRCRALAARGGAGWWAAGSAELARAGGGSLAGAASRRGCALGTGAVCRGGGGSGPGADRAAAGAPAGAAARGTAGAGAGERTGDTLESGGGRASADAAARVAALGGARHGARAPGERQCGDRAAAGRGSTTTIPAERPHRRASSQRPDDRVFCSCAGFGSVARKRAQVEPGCDRAFPCGRSREDLFWLDSR